MSIKQTYGIVRDHKFNAVGANDLAVANNLSVPAASIVNASITNATVSTILTIPVVPSVPLTFLAAGSLISVGPTALLYISTGSAWVKVGGQ